MIAEEIVARLRVDAGQFAAGLASARGALAGFQGSARSAGKSMQSAGRSMTTGMTLPIVGLGAVVLKSAADFESAFTGVVKTVGGTEPEIAKLRTAILDMSEEMPASAEEIAGVAEAAGQLGIPIGQIEGFTRTMIMMGEATNMTSQEAADSFAHFQNIMGVSSEDMAANSMNVGNAVVELGNKFAATESEIMNTAVRMAGAARTAGMAQPDILALATAMADVGISSELGGTAMSQTFASMSSAIKGGGSELAAFAKVSGQSGQEFQRQFQTNAPMAVLSFVQGLKRIKQSGGDVFKTLDDLGIRGQRQQQTLLSLAGASRKFASAIKVSNDAFTKGNGLNREYENRLKDFNSQLKMTANQAKRVGIDLGLALLPAFKSALTAAQPLIGVIKNLANAFTSASPSTQTFVVSLLGVAAAAGPVTWILGKITSAAGIAAGAFRTLVGASMGLASLGGILGGLGSVAGVLLTVVPAALAFNGAIMGITGKLGELSGLPSVFYSIGQSIVSMVPGVGPALAAMNQISGSVGGLGGLMNLLTGSTNSTTSSMIGLKGAVSATSASFKQFSALSMAASGAALNSQIASMRQQLVGNAGAWGQVKGQILQTAAAQQQQRDIAVQAANGNQAAIQRANAAYGQSVVKMASVIPASKQAGGAFKLLAQSANMSAGQLRGAVAKYKQGGMGAGKALAAGLRQGSQQAGQAGKQAASRAASQTAQGMRAGGNKIKAAAKSAGKGASTGIAQGVRQGAGQAKSAGNKVTQQLQQGFRQGGSKLKSAGQQAGKQGPQGIASGVQQGSGQAIAAETQMIAQLATTMVAAGGTLMSAGYAAGSMMGAGLVNGINSMLGAAQAAAAEIAAVAEQAMRDKAKIASPSKVWKNLGVNMVEGLVKGLGYKKKDVKDAASDLADATGNAFNSKAMDFKQGAKKIVDYIVGVRQAIQQFAGVQAFDVSGAQSQAAAYTEARDEAIAAAMREAAALQAKNRIQQKVNDATAAIKKWDQAGNHYQVANALERQKSSLEKLTEATEAYNQAKEASNEADKAFGQTPRGGVSAASIIADMTSRQGKATQFSESIKKLKNRGLNQKAIQQLIESGVDSGGAIASALLAGKNSKKNIALVNWQTNLMETASRSLGDYAGQAKFGQQGTFDRQTAIAETKIEVKDGAIRINWGGSAMTANDKAEFQKIAKESLDKALKQLARELRQKKKQK